MEKETPYEKLKRETDELETARLNRIDKGMYEASGGTPTEEVNACSGSQDHNPNCDGFCDSLDSTPTEEWEGEFEDLWDEQTGGEYIPTFIYPFIHNLLTSHNAELARKIEGMKIDENANEGGIDYNQALDAVLALLSTNK